jgi:serine/threonine protein kinase
MEKYDIIRRLGGGSFADVFLGKEIATSDMVAIKVLKKKYRKLDQCNELREVVSLQKLCKDSLSSQKGYDNIIKLKEIIFEKKNGKLSLVFEYMETDLYELMKKRSPSRLSEDEIKDITYQILLGLYHMHKYGFFHRDMKPENLLLTGKKVKIADFGLAREIRSIPPFTEYVSTRYYRAPECILRSQNYNSPVDIWAVGCIMAEMYMHPMPLFYGSSEKEVFIKICTTLGSPNKNNWNEGVNQASKIGMKYPQSSGIDLANIVIGASPEAIDLMKQMLKWAPSARATAANLLNHPFFNGLGYDLKRVTNSNFFNDFGDVKAFNKTNRRFRPNNNSNNNNEQKEEKINNKKDNEDNVFSKLVNDTKGSNKLLDQLKKEENEENKNFEKNNFKFNTEDKLMSKKPLQYNKRLSGKKVINEEKENDNESFNEDDKYNWGKKNNEDNNNNINDNKYNDFNFDFNENKFNSSNNNKNDNESEFKYLFNSEKKSSVRNIGLRDNFRKDAFQNKKDEYDYLFDDNKSKENNFGNLFNKEKEKDLSNIDSEINKILSKDIGLSNNNNKFGNNNFSNKNYRLNNNNNNNILNNDFGSFGLKFKSQKISHNNNINGIGLDKPYERSNLKPIINGGRRGGGGLMALGYEPKKKLILENDNFSKGLGLNRKKETNNKFGYGFKRDLAPVIMKEKKNENFYDYNNNYKEDKFSFLNNNGNSGNNNMFGRKDKFSLYERNNPLFNQFSNGNNDIIGASRRKKNYYSSPNSLGWDLL